MKEQELAGTLLDWSTIFIRLSLHDFNLYTRNAGLSLAQMIVLMHLHHRGPSEVTHLCELMQVSPAGASQMVERMVHLGVVQRTEVPGDRRVRQVSLTGQGRQIVLESIEARQAWIDQLVKRLSAEEREGVAAALHILNLRAKELENSSI
jgi:DNA-binding MarR family transcriptional regulator